MGNEFVAIVPARAAASARHHVCRCNSFAYEITGSAVSGSGSHNHGFVGCKQNIRNKQQQKKQTRSQRETKVNLMHIKTACHLERGVTKDSCKHAPCPGPLEAARSR